MPHFVIVSRERPDLFDRLTDRFRESGDIRVIFDRRTRVSGPALQAERRLDVETTDATMWVEGYIVVRRGESP